MAIDFHVCTERRLAFFRMAGTIQTRECADIFLDYTNHPEFNPDYAFLTTTRDLTQVESSFIQIVGAVQRIKPCFAHFQRESLSVIHAPRDLSFGMARILQQVVEPVSNFRFEITRDPVEALSLVGQPEPDFETLEAALGMSALSE